jgi:hypothetical protein
MIYCHKSYNHHKEAVDAIQVSLLLVVVDHFLIPECSRCITPHYF